MSETRIATVKATGKRYLVQQLKLDSNPELARCHVWGEVVSYRNLSTKHEGSKVFRLDAVTVETVTKTVALVDALFQQGVASKREAGHTVVRTRGGNYRDLGTPEHQAKVAQFGADCAKALADLPPGVLNLLTSKTPKKG